MGGAPQPPRLWALLARLLVRGGDDSRLVRHDLTESFARDLARGIEPRRARRRYAKNVLGSVWSLGAGSLARLVTRGAVVDVKLGARMLGKQPHLTGVAILALGLGIPASLGMHHVMRTLHSPLPVPEGERVMGIRQWDRELSDPVLSSVHDLALWRTSLRSFSSIGAARSYMLNVYAGEPGAPPVRGAELTASTFTVMRAAPLLGRVFGPEDEARGAPDVVILREDLWAARFARAPDIVGRIVRIGRRVGILLLARTATRMAELSIRTALGASRTRIVTQLFIEALVLSLLATGLGLVVADGVARAVMQTLRTLGSGLPYWMDLGLGTGIVLIALGLAAFCAVLAGVTPALKVTGVHVQANLQRLAAGTSSLRFGLASTLLIVAEVVLSVGFMAMGGTLVRSAFQDREGQLGFQPERYYQATLRLPWIAPAGTTSDRDEEAASNRAPGEVAREVLRRLLADDAVRGAGIGLELPGSMPGGEYIELELEGEGAGRHRVGDNRVDVGFFRGLNRPILAGRDFAEADLEAEPDAYGRRPAAIVNTSFVEQLLGGRNPIGQRFRPAGSRDRMWFEIVGVVGPFGMNPRNPSRDAGYYLVAPAVELTPIRFLVKVDGDPATFAPRFRGIVASVDPEATLEAAMPVSEVMSTENNFFRLVFALQLGLAGIAFLLSVSGLYALMSFTVSQRTREIGIRTALGARPWSIVSTIGLRAALQLGAGVALGGVLAWYLLDSITVEVAVMDVDIPLTVAATMVAAVFVGVAACASPTRRGLRIQPSEALRES